MRTLVRKTFAYCAIGSYQWFAQQVALTCELPLDGGGQRGRARRPGAASMP
jgi:hypothetical protein